jgi:hypothetical protein
LGALVGSVFGNLFAGPTPSLAGSAATAAGSAYTGTGLKVSADFFSLPARASGGDVYPNQAYLVGERGPEVFVPNASGSIVPNERLPNLGGSSIVIHNHFAAGTDLRTVDQAATQIGLRVQRAMRRSF